MAPLFCSFFFFIVVMNLLGLIPCFLSATSNVSVTGALAAITLGFMVFGVMYRHGPGVPEEFCAACVPGLC